MSMIGYLLAVKAETLDELARDAASVPEFLAAAIEDQDDLGADFLDVDKAWHAIHFLLTGTVRGGESELAWVTFAPTEIGPERETGRARALTPDQTAEIAKALASINSEKLKKQCDWAQMNANDIYPQNWRAGDQDYIAENFTALKKFYEAAARKRLGVVQWRS